MSSHPFYSSEVREALVEVAATHEGGQDESSDVPRKMSTPSSSSTDNIAEMGSAIRGKGYASSSSSADGEKNTGADDDDQESDDLSSSESSVEAIDEKVPPMEAIEENTAQQRQPKGRHNKKSKHKRSKDDILQKMGNAPSILLPLKNVDTNRCNSTDLSARRKALEIPNILLPINYLRENHNWNASSVAKSLLSSWDQLNGPSCPTILVILLQSGRFAAAVFSLQGSGKSTTMNMLAHKTSTRYTVRKGQGGSQSNYDQSKHKAKSVGAQLRREGEKQLREDVKETWKEWKKLGHVQRAMWVYVSCPKGMRRDYLFGGEDGGGGNALIEKNDERLRSIPLDVGRPTMEATAAVLDCVLRCSVREMTEDEQKAVDVTVGDGEEIGKKESSDTNNIETMNGEEVKVEESLEGSMPEPPPYTPLHQAVLDGDLPHLMELLKLLDESEENDATADTDQSPQSSVDYDINTIGGPDNQTPLHLASSSTHPDAASLLQALLVQGHANPCAIDARGRPPYFLASSDKNRETFRLARGTLGEDYCLWDDEAKVGPALTEEDVQMKKAKAAEKKRRQRVRQKEKKANEKAEAEKAAAQQRKDEEKKKQEEEAKRIRDGLKPKTSTATNVCDFCQKAVKGKRRSQMFQRLEYAYCSTDCVKRHQRELMAAAATARLG